MRTITKYNVFRTNDIICHPTRRSMWWKNTLYVKSLTLTFGVFNFMIEEIYSWQCWRFLPTFNPTFLIFVFLLPLCECFHFSGILYNNILYYVVLYHMGVAVQECEDCLSFYRITISECDCFIAIVCCVSGVNLTFILFPSQLWTTKL